MIEVLDRIPTYPGRVRLVPVNGLADTYDMVRADEPIEPGTPLNRALFESVRSDLSILNQNVANIINSHASLAPIGSLTAGAEFGVYENGILVPYIKVTGDYGGSGRSAVIRKHIYKVDVFSTGSHGNAYKDSYTDIWLSTEYLNMLESQIRDAIEEVNVICTVGRASSALETISRKVFLASETEFGIVDGAFNVEGTPFPYFNSNDRRKALFNGVATQYWTRTPTKSGSEYVGIIEAAGYTGAYTWYGPARGIRPVFTLPHDFEVNVGAPGTHNVMATAEVI